MRVLALIAFALLGSTAPATETMTYQEYFDSFLLLDEDGKPRASYLSDLGGSPVGALLALPQKGGKMTCTATHYAPGLVITAAHCLKTGLPAKDHFVLFYNKDGVKTAAPVQRFLFRGDHLMDIAVLKISREVADTWDVGNLEIKKYRKEQIASKIPSRETIKAWSYTPLVHFPQYAPENTSRLGMVFTPNDCIASRTIPRIVAKEKIKGTKKYKTVGELSLKKVGHIDEKIHIFLDDCTRRIVRGNSGSLITASNDFTQKIGILHLVVATKEAVWKELSKLNLNKSLITFFYIGNDDTPKEVAWSSSEFLIGSGTTLEALKKRKPRLLPSR